jgi:hypothetical protein
LDPLSDHKELRRCVSDMFSLTSDWLNMTLNHHDVQRSNVERIPQCQ